MLQLLLLVNACVSPLPCEAGAQLASFHSDDENKVRCLLHIPNNSESYRVSRRNGCSIATFAARLLRTHLALSCAAAMITPGGSPSQVPQVFGIAFSTPVSDSRGAPHALEHSVLVGGTQKYPVKVGPYINQAKRL